jgi:two-component system cell cycle response regulator DivK
MPRRTVLVVEDNVINRRLLRDLLVYGGHEVWEAGGVLEALERLEHGVPDIALLDIQIPGGGGESLLDRIRADPRTTTLKVVAVTALAMPGDRERLLAAGFDAYVSKPIDTREFLSLIFDLLE